MKKSILILAFAVLAVGCTGSKTETTGTLEISDPTHIQTERVITVGLGDTCTTDSPCSQGLECVSGTCKEQFKDESVVCEKETKPVCAINPNGVKVEYLNPCQAKRYGAEIQNEGFCPEAIEKAKADKAEAEANNNEA